MLTENDEYTPIAIQWMRWTTPTRLAVLVNQIQLAYKNTSSPLPSSLDANSRAESNRPAEDPFPRAQDHRSATDPSWSPWESASGAMYGIDIINRSSTAILRAGDIRRLDENGRETVLHPSVIDVPPTEDGSILLRCHAGTKHEIYRLNTVTGKLTHVRDDFGERGMLPLFDRQGRLRGGVETTKFQKPPFRYVLDKNALLTLGRWQPLDQVAAPAGVSAFQVGPENQFTKRSIPLGFDEDPDVLYYASNEGRDTYGIYSLNVRSGKRTSLALEDTTYDLIGATFGNFADSGDLVFDRFDRKLAGKRTVIDRVTTLWLREDVASVQRSLDQVFPGSNVEIIEWSRDLTRFLVLIHSHGSPGSFFLFEPARQRIFDIARRAGWTDASRGHRSFRFTIEGPSQRRITGLLTFPRIARFKNVPVIVRCSAEPWTRVPLEYQPETVAVAEMGFAVLQIDNRGAWGFGIRHREALKPGYEATQIEDILAALEKLSRRYRIDLQRVALMGERHGGYVALRGLQMRPERFRCAVTIDAPIDLGSWLENDRWTRRSTTLELSRTAYGDPALFLASPLLRHPEQITKPVCLLTYPGPNGAPRSSTYLETRRFASALRQQGTPVEFTELDSQYALPDAQPRGADADRSLLVELNSEFMQRLPRAQAAVYRNVESFLNAYVYDYAVKLGPLKLIPDAEIELPPSTRQ